MSGAFGSRFGFLDLELITLCLTSYQKKKNLDSFSFLFSAMASGAGTGASSLLGMQSHRGHGFALGHPQFQPGKWPTATGAMGSTDVAMAGLPGRHGSGAGPRDRERDRPRGSTLLP